MNQPLLLRGVHHSARPTWKLKETVTFYRDVMGLPLVHAISARGWGPANHPDFLHFFFDSGQGSTIAFFHYIGDPQPEWLRSRGRYDDDATHTAWQVADAAEVSAWRDRLQSRGVEVTPEMRHELIESIYFRDPNGYLLEITRMLRPFQALDANDAARTLQAAIALEEAAQAGGEPFRSIDPVWQLKAHGLGTADGKARIYVVDVEEFSPVVAAGRQIPGAAVHGPEGGYWRVESAGELVLNRKAMGLKPALWWSMLTGGFQGRMASYTRDELRLVPA